MDFSIYLIILLVGAFGLFIGIANRVTLPKLSNGHVDGSGDDLAIDLADGWDESRKPPHGWLLPLGLIFIAGGILGGVVTLQMDVRASSLADTANMDLIGYRTMFLVIAVSHVIIGWMLCCTSLIVNAVAKFS